MVVHRAMPLNDELRFESNYWRAHQLLTVSFKPMTRQTVLVKLYRTQNIKALKEMCREEAELTGRRDKQGERSRNVPFWCILCQ